MTVHQLLVLLLCIPVMVGLVIFLTRRTHLVLPLILVGFLPGTALAVFGALALERPWIHRFEWLPGWEIGWSLDRVSLALILLVYLISFLVHLFSYYYLREEKGLYRYYALLGFFTSTMIGLLSADHLLLLFIFWELVGFSSYLLIGFWYSDRQKAQSARTAFITNRVADVCLLFGILTIWTVTGNAFISDMVPADAGGLVTLGAIGLVIGAMGKSAQFPFHTWLPHAMAGPTPVSALIHAATMVAAGVYLLVRVAPTFSPEVQLFTSLVGAVTALLGAFFALAQNDIKKVLAYSTISQLGLMFMAAGFGAVEVGFFHLWTHAFFKAGLFLSAGVIIHAMGHMTPDADPQDMRAMKGLRSQLPITFAAYTLCLLALIGLPFFSGFLSKDAILTAMWNKADAFGLWGMLPFVLAALSVLGTAYYMGRQWWMLFGDREQSSRASEPWLTVRLPLFILAIGSLWFWYNLNPFGHDFVMLHVLFLSNAGEPVVPWVAPLSLLLVAGGLTIAFRSRHFFGRELRSRWLLASANGLYFDRAYHQFIILPYNHVVSWVSALDTKIIDRVIEFMAVSVVVAGKVAGLCDRWIVDGFVKFAAYLSRKVGGLLRSFHSNSMQTQFFWMLVGLAFLIFWGIFYLPSL